MHHQAREHTHIPDRAEKAPDTSCKNKTPIKPHVRNAKHTPNGTSSVKLIKYIPFKEQMRGVRTHGTHKQIASTSSADPSQKEAPFTPESQGKDILKTSAHQYSHKSDKEQSHP